MVALQVLHARLVVVRVRVGVLVVLRDVLELFVAEFTVKGAQDGADLGLDGRFLGDGSLEGAIVSLLINHKMGNECKINEDNMQFARKLNCKWNVDKRCTLRRRPEQTDRYYTRTQRHSAF